MVSEQGPGTLGVLLLQVSHFLPQLRVYHVLVHMDNTVVVSYINHQGRLHSRLLFRQAQQIPHWAEGMLLL